MVKKPKTAAMIQLQSLLTWQSMLRSFNEILLPTKVVMTRKNLNMLWKLSSKLQFSQQLILIMRS